MRFRRPSRSEVHLIVAAPDSRIILSPLREGVSIPGTPNLPHELPLEAVERLVHEFLPGAWSIIRPHLDLFDTLILRHWFRNRILNLFVAELSEEESIAFDPVNLPTLASSHSFVPWSML